MQSEVCSLQSPHWDVGGRKKGAQEFEDLKSRAQVGLLGWEELSAILWRQSFQHHLSPSFLFLFH